MVYVGYSRNDGPSVVNEWNFQLSTYRETWEGLIFVVDRTAANEQLKDSTEAQ